MARATIDRLIINSPCDEPARHGRYGRVSCAFDLAEGLPMSERFSPVMRAAMVEEDGGLDSPPMLCHSASGDELPVSSASMWVNQR